MSDETSKRPAWATGVGIALIVLNLFALAGAVPAIFLSRILDFQSKMISDVLSQKKLEDEESRKTMDAFLSDLERHAAAKRPGAAKKPVEPRPAAPPPEDPELKMITETFDKFLKVPEWFKTWSVAAGITALLTALLGLTAGAFFLTLRRAAVPLFYGVAVVKISMALANAVLAYVAFPLIQAMAGMTGSAVSLGVNVTLLIIVALSDKTAFKGPE